MEVGFSDESYTQMRVTWQDFDFTVESAVQDGELMLLVTPSRLQRYPAMLTLIALSFFDGKIKNDCVFQLSTGAALLVSLCTVLSEYIGGLSFIHRLPLSSLGLGWILPAIVCGAIGFFLPCKKRTERPSGKLAPAFFRATASAFSDTSLAHTSASGRMAATETAIAPEPVPISTSLPRSGKHCSDSSTSNSVSGRGISTSGVTVKGKP